MLLVLLANRTIVALQLFLTDDCESTILDLWIDESMSKTFQIYVVTMIETRLW